MTALHVQPTGRGRRTRHGAAWTCLPPLRPAQHTLLCDWLRADAAERQWQSLLDIAGAQRLELAEELLAQLLHAGALHTKERFVHAQWRVERVVWSNVAALQEAVGLRSAATRESDRQQLAAQLQALGEREPWLESAVRHCLDSRQGDAVRQARLQLLQALASWQAEQRFGLRQDFAQHARGTTKAITETEWKWLQAHVPLEALGIARFAPLLWLGGTLALSTPRGRIDVAAAGLCGLPTRLFGTPAQAQAPPPLLAGRKPRQLRAPGAGGSARHLRGLAARPAAAELARGDAVAAAARPRSRRRELRPRPRGRGHCPGRRCAVAGGWSALAASPHAAG